MTRQHFEAVAAAVRELRTLPKMDADDVAVILADRLAPFNPHFNRGRFLKACKHTRAGEA